MSMSKQSSESRVLTSLDRWLKSRGFRGNPFEYSNAEYEQDLPGYFVDIGEFDGLLRVTSPCVVFAERGCGKTAQRQMLASRCRPLQSDSPLLAIHYTYGGFENALIRAGNQFARIKASHHIESLLHFGITALADEALRDENVLNALRSPPTILRTEAYLKRYAPHKIPEIGENSQTIALDSLTPLERLRDFAQLLEAAGFKRGVIFVDGLDEFPETAKDASQAISFLASLLGTLPIIECPGLGFKFFLSQELEQGLRNNAWFRTDRLYITRITWNEERLLDLIKQRLAYFSLREPPYVGLAQLCEDELAPIINPELIAHSHKLPRPALSLAGMLFREHTRQAIPPELISVRTWRRVKEIWLHQDSYFTVDTHLQTSPNHPETISPLPQAMARYSASLLRIEEEKGLVWLGEKEIRKQIKPKDYRVLLCLYQHEGEVCTKELIAQEAWRGELASGVTDQAMATSIRRLRAVFEQYMLATEFIETIRGKGRQQGGYRLYPQGFAKVNKKVKKRR
jgi:hypothetical protein